MDSIQRIECKNRAAFVMSFLITNGKTNSADSGNYPVGNSRTIDLAASKFSEGDTVWPIVSAFWGKTQPSQDRFTFSMNGNTAVFEIEGTTLNYSIRFKGIEHIPEIRPDGFPPTIPIVQEEFINWDHTIIVPAVWTCQPRKAGDVVEACNWAAGKGWKVRPRGIMHNWSPLSVTQGLSADNLLLIDFTILLNDISFISSYGQAGAAVRAGAGALMGDLMEFLQKQSGTGAAAGYSFPHVPAPGNLTIGGVLAINGHGTAVPTPPNDSFHTTYGSMSNRILELTVVVTDPSDPVPGYRLKTLRRGDKDLTALMTQLGRTLIVEVVLQVVENYNLRCQSITNINKSVLFKTPDGNIPPPNSCGEFLNNSGRIEIIWFPFTDYPWLKVWTVVPVKPSPSRKVDAPYNYPFSDNLPDWVIAFINTILYIDPSGTPKFGKLMLDMTNMGLDAPPSSRDIWGPSKDTLIYVKDTTLRVTANGYAVLMNKSYVQQAIADFTQQFEKMLSDYMAQNKYPVNSPLEIRVTGLDSEKDMPSITGGPAGRPVISSLASDEEAVQNHWDVAVWFDVLTIPGTRYSADFYTELEAWMLQHYISPKARVVPEWSKGWAYTPNGPWKNTKFINEVKAGFTQHRAKDDNWQWEVTTLQQYDKANLYQSQLTQTLFS